MKSEISNMKFPKANRQVHPTKLRSLLLNLPSSVSISANLWLKQKPRRAGSCPIVDGGIGTTAKVSFRKPLQLVPLKTSHPL